MPTSGLCRPRLLIALYEPSRRVEVGIILATRWFAFSEASSMRRGVEISKPLSHRRTSPLRVGATRLLTSRVHCARASDYADTNRPLTTAEQDFLRGVGITSRSA